jgi:hypothetical protein
MSHLVPCLSCHRHVLVVEERCPFCGAERSPELRASSPPALPKRRLGRAALFTFGATLVGGACGDVVTTNDSGADGPKDAQTGAAGSSGGAGTTGAGGKGGTTGAGGAGGTTGQAGTTGAGGTGIAPPYGIAPLYGVPATTDGGNNK